MSNGATTPTPTEQVKFVSPDTYTKGETDVKKTLSEIVSSEIGKVINKFLIYFITTLLVGMGVVIWNMNSKLNELEGKYSSPDKIIETISTRIENLEKTNKELQEKNYQLEVEKLQLQLENKKEKK